jgi:pectate lyase
LAKVTFSITVRENYSSILMNNSKSIFTDYENNADGINTRDEAQLLVENNVWVTPKKPLYSTDEGYAVARGNDFAGASNTAPTGTLTSVPYTYSLTAVGSVKASVTASAGATLSF